MLRVEPHTRFLLRASALLIGLLTLWWFVLRDPMLYLLKNAAGAFISIEEQASGDWTVRVPIEKTLPATELRPTAQRIHSIYFDIQRSDVITFTFSIPVYWAIVLATPSLRRNLRPLLLGTACICSAELALLLVFARITAAGAASQLAGGGDATGKWGRNFGIYLVVNVLPYAVPFIVALSLHRELRREVFAIAGDAVVRAPGEKRQRA